MTFLEFFSLNHRPRYEPVEHGGFDDVHLFGSKVADESPRILAMIRANARKAVPKAESTARCAGRCLGWSASPATPGHPSSSSVRLASSTIFRSNRSRGEHDG